MRTKFLTLVFFFTLAIVSAQKSAEQMAQGVTNEMKQVLSLTDEQADALYVIHLDKVQKLQAVNKDAEMDAPAKKDAKRSIYLAARDKFLTVFDKQTMKKWYAYQKEKQSKR
ncbi:MAG: hypothetical protein ACPHXR_06620 [Flavicella sp.]